MTNSITLSVVLVLSLLCLTFIQAKIIPFENVEYSFQPNNTYVFSQQINMLTLPEKIENIGSKPKVNINFVVTASEDMILNFVATPTQMIDELNKSGQKLFCDYDGTLLNNLPHKMQLQSIQIKAIKDNPIKTDFDVEYIGPFSLLIVKCAGDHKTTARISGTVTFLNPFGHLEAEKTGSLLLSAILILVDLAFGIFWAYLMFGYRNQLLVIQKLLSYLFLATIAAHFFYFLDLFWENNISGTRHFLISSFSIFFSIFNSTLARAVVLLISMGFGPMKAQLDQQTVKRVSTFSFLFYLSSFIYETGSLLYSQFRIDVEENRQTILTSISAILSFNSYWFIFAISLPIIVMDSILFMWVFTSMSQTMEDLKKDSQTLKLSMYKRFVSILTIALELAVLLSLAQAIQFFFLSQFSATPLFEWTTSFGFELFWKCGYVSLLICSMFIWRPTKHNQIYASSQQLPQSESEAAKMESEALGTIDDDEELQEMTKNGELKQEFKLEKNDVNADDSDEEMKIERLSKDDEDEGKAGLKMRLEVENKK